MYIGGLHGVHGVHDTALYAYDSFSCTFLYQHSDGQALKRGHRLCVEGAGLGRRRRRLCGERRRRREGAGVEEARRRAGQGRETGAEGRRAAQTSGHRQRRAARESVDGRLSKAGLRTSEQRAGRESIEGRGVEQGCRHPPRRVNESSRSSSQVYSRGGRAVQVRRLASVHTDQKGASSLCMTAATGRWASLPRSAAILPSHSDAAD